MTAPTLPVYVDTARGVAQVEALRQSILGLGPALRNVNTIAQTAFTSPLDKLRAQIGTDIADIKKMLSGGLAAAVSSGATGVKEGGDVVAKALAQQTLQFKQLIGDAQQALAQKAAAGPKVKLLQFAASDSAGLQVRAAMAAARSSGTPFSTLGGSAVNKMTGDSFSEDDFRRLSGMPTRAEMSTFSTQLKAQMLAEQASTAETSRLRTLSATRNTEDDFRRLIGAPSRGEMTTFSQQLKAHMLAEQASLVETSRLRVLSATKNTEDDFRRLIGAPTRTEMSSFSARLKAQMLAEQAETTATAMNQVRAATAAARVSGAPFSTLSGQLVNPAVQAQASAGFKKMTVDMNDAHAAARGLAGGFGTLWLTYGRILPLLAGAGISAGFVAIIKQGAQVQNTFATIAALSEETSQSITGLNQKMLEMARTGPFGPQEIAEAMKTLSLAGLNAKEVTSSISDVLRFSIAGDTSIKSSADVLSTVATAFRLNADQYSYVGDVIAKTAAVSKSSVESIGMSFKTASVINAQFGASLEDVGLGLALLSNTGIQGTAAGTALRNMYVDLLGRSPKVRKELESMAKAIGVQSIAMDQATGKALPFIDMMKNLNKALETKTPEAQARSISTVTSERGAKAVFASLVAMQQAAKETGQGVDSLLDEMKQKIDNSAGFMAIAAAKMALTPLNQMKAVSATLQASIVETFDALQPQVIRVAEEMKKAFNSEEFRNGIARLASGIADLTVFFVKHIDVIVLLAGAYTALKVALAMEALLTGLAARTTAASLAMQGYAVNTANAARATAAAVPVTVELTAAQAALAVASSGAAGGKAKAAASAGALMGSLGLLTGIVSKLTLPLTIAWAAWELYSFWSARANVSTEEGITPRQALIKSLEVERQRLDDLNAAKALGITYDELLFKKKGKEQADSGEARLNSARSAYNNAFNEAQDYAKKGSPNPYRQRELDVQAAKARSVMEKEAAKNDLENAKVNELTADIMAKSAKRNQEAKDAIRNNAKPPVSGDEGIPDSPVKVARVNYERMLELENNYYSKHKKTLDDAFAQEQADIKRNVAQRELTEGESYVRSLNNAIHYEQAQLQLIEDTYNKKLVKLTAADKGKDPEGLANARQKAKDSYNEQITQLAQLTRARKEASSDGLAKSLSDDEEAFRKSFTAMRVYNKELELKAEAERVSAGMSVEARAGYVAQAEYVAHFAKEEEALTKIVVDQTMQFYSLANAMNVAVLTNDGAVLGELTDNFTKVGLAVQTSADKLREFREQIAAGGTAAARDGMSKELVKQFNDTNIKIKNTLSDAIIAGSEKGSVGMRESLYNALNDFAKQKFRITIDAFLNPISTALTNFINPAAGAAAGAAGVGNLGINGALGNLFSPAAHTGTNVLSGGGIGDFFSGIGSMLGFANGGKPEPGVPYWVGETGRELRVDGPGAIIPHGQSNTVGSGGQPIYIDVKVDASGSSTQVAGDEPSGRKLGDMIGNVVRDVLIKERRQGGLLSS